MQELSGDRAWLVALGAPALGMAFTVTVVASYVPVLLEAGSDPVTIGLLVGAEDFFGIFVPALAGNASDRHSRTVRDRLRLLLAAAAVVVGALVTLGVLALVGVLSVWASGLSLVLLYVGFYAFLAPYGGLLLEVATGLSSLVAAGLVVVTVGVLVRGLGERGDAPVSGATAEGRPSTGAIRALLRDPAIRRLALANAL